VSRARGQKETTMISKSLSFVALTLAFATGCSFAARSPDMYREDVQKLLEGQSASVQSCFVTALQADKTAGGTVTVRFTVAKDTGAFENASVDAARTTAPEPVSQCVLKSLEGLVLNPGDAQQGDATFAWEFRANPAKEVLAPAEPGTEAPPAS
jgi:hypothetical protein